MLVKTAGFVLAATPLAAAAAAVIVGAQCGADNCLRVLRSPSKIDEARDDCAQWLETAAPAAPITVTGYSTILSTSTVVASVTIDNTIDQIVTVYVPETRTVKTSVTVTVSTGIAGQQKFRKRSVEKPVPAYASACSGAVRYSSACSCISASATPTTTTVTVPTTVWQIESQTSVATKHELVTVATASETVVATATVTETVTETVRPFYMIIEDKFGPWYLYVRPFEQYVRVNQDSTKKQVFELREDGTVWLGDRFWGRPTTAGWGYTSVYPQSSLSDKNFEPLKCKLNPENVVSCSINAAPATLWGAPMYPVLNSDAVMRGRDTAFFLGTQHDIDTWVGNQRAASFLITAVSAI